MSIRRIEGKAMENDLRNRPEGDENDLESLLLNGSNADIFPKFEENQQIENIVHLIKSDLPLKEAENGSQFIGFHLFQQAISTEGPNPCLLCSKFNDNKHLFYSSSDLEGHYSTDHGLKVLTTTALFDTNIIYLVNPEDREVECSSCILCSQTLNTLEDLNEHYRTSHLKKIKIINKSDIEINKKFLCSLCPNTSIDFELHYNHMKRIHNKTTHICRYCRFFSSCDEDSKKHETESHLNKEVGPTYSCPACMVCVKEKQKLERHVRVLHTVKTGEETWSCVKCLHPYNNIEELIGHFSSICVILQSTESKTDDEEIKKPDVDSPGTSEVFSTSNPIHEEGCDPSNMDENTCFLCCMKFRTIEMCRKHQHHVHMCWVESTETDYSKVELSGHENTESLNKGTDIKSLSRKEESEIGKAYSKLDFNISIDDIPDQKELLEIGFPNKFGHYCPLCDAVIKNYRLYYLHMNNLHQLEKRFKCNITMCKKGFSQSNFQIHAMNHNQKSKHYCSMCDNVFGNDKELQDHLISSDHAVKCMQIKKKYKQSQRFRYYNYRCKVCHNFFGLYSSFVDHMEKETHSYKCQECGLLFLEPGPRQTHIQKKHPETANISEIKTLRGQCKELFCNIMKLVADQPPNIGKNVSIVVQNLIERKINSYKFSVTLSEILNSDVKPGLDNFIQENLQNLEDLIRNGEIPGLCLASTS